MNIYIKLLIIITLIANIVSCTDINSWGDTSRTPSLKANFIYFPQSHIEVGGTLNLITTTQLQAVNTPWKISNTASEWLTVSPLEGDGDATITFAAKENPTSDNVRTAVIGLYSTDADYIFNKQIVINQSQADVILHIGEQKIELTRKSQSKKISIRANTQWNASCSANWIRLAPSVAEGILEIIVDDNNGTSDRTAQIEISGSTSSYIIVTQHGYVFEDLISELDFESKASNRTINIETDGSWSASSSESWIHISPTFGEGNAILSVSVDANKGKNNRIGKIAVTVGDVTKYISVQQKGMYMDITTSSSSEIPSEGGVRTITFNCSECWYVDCKNTSWISVDKTSGNSGVNTISLSFAKNTQSKSRTDTTFIRTNNDNLQDLRIITVQISINDNIKFIDLGLPSGTLWASYSVGARNEYEPGYLFAWGEVEPKSQFSLENYRFCNGTSKSITKYCCDSEFGICDYNTHLKTEDDAATVNWGDFCRIPTFEELKELRSNCKWTEKVINGIGGKLVEGPNGNSIFIPSNNSKSQHSEMLISIWTDESNGTEHAGSYDYWYGYEYEYVWAQRYVGAQVRPVYGKKHIVPKLATPTEKVLVSNSDVTIYGVLFDSDLILSQGMTEYGIRYSSNNGESWKEIYSTNLSNNIFHVILNNLKYDETYTYQAFAKQNGTLYTSESRQIVVYSNFDSSQDHEYVDLGLPSGIMWATCNVGANSPEEYGDYFAWGEVNGYNSGKTNFNWDSYKYCKGSSNSLTKYCIDANSGEVDNKTELELIDDAARQNWGGNWRMPSFIEVQELQRNCESKFDKVNNISGLRLTSKINGKSIFIPSAGQITENGRYEVGTRWACWSTTLYSSTKAYSLYGGDGYIDDYDFRSRNRGRTIRPVFSKYSIK